MRGRLSGLGGMDLVHGNRADLVKLLIWCMEWGVLSEGDPSGGGYMSPVSANLDHLIILNEVWNFP